MGPEELYDFRDQNGEMHKLLWGNHLKIDYFSDIFSQANHLLNEN